MKTDEKFKTKPAKRDKDMWKLRNGLTQTQEFLKGLFWWRIKTFQGLIWAAQRIKEDKFGWFWRINKDSGNNSLSTWRHFLLGCWTWTDLRELGVLWGTQRCVCVSAPAGRSHRPEGPYCPSTEILIIMVCFCFTGWVFFLPTREKMVDSYNLWTSE